MSNLEAAIDAAVNTLISAVQREARHQQIVTCGRFKAPEVAVAAYEATCAQMVGDAIGYAFCVDPTLRSHPAMVGFDPEDLAIRTSRHAQRLCSERLWSADDHHLAAFLAANEGIDLYRGLETYRKSQGTKLEGEHELRLQHLTKQAAAEARFVARRNAYREVTVLRLVERWRASADAAVSGGASKDEWERKAKDQARGRIERLAEHPQGANPRENAKDAPSSAACAAAIALLPALCDRTTSHRDRVMQRLTGADAPVKAWLAMVSECLLLSAAAERATWHAEASTIETVATYHRQKRVEMDAGLAEIATRLMADKPTAKQVQALALEAADGRQHEAEALVSTIMSMGQTSLDKGVSLVVERLGVLELGRRAREAVLKHKADIEACGVGYSGDDAEAELRRELAGVVAQACAVAHYLVALKDEEGMAGKAAVKTVLPGMLDCTDKEAVKLVRELAERHFVIGKTRGVRALSLVA